MKMRGSAPHPARGLDPLTRKNLASEANWPDASLGIELDFWIARAKTINPTRPNEGAYSDAR